MKASEHPPRVRQRALPLKLSTAVSLMIGSVIGAVLLLVYALWYMQISNATRDGLKETALAVARTMADMPQVKRGLEAPPQQQIIQPLAQAITRRNDLLYAIVTDMQGIRYSHPTAQSSANRSSATIFSRRCRGKRMSPSTTGCWPRRYGCLRRCSTNGISKSAWWWSAFH